MSTRLDTRAADLARQIQAAAPDSQRRIAVNLAELTIARVPVDEPAVGAALHALRSARWGDSPERTAAEQLAERLDETAWDVQDQVDEGNASQSDYIAAFTRARAVSALVFALAPDAAIAALETAYEAEAATEDLLGIRAAVNAVLGD